MRWGLIMATPFAQNIIAMMWDFDKTLTPSYMQEPLFKSYRADADAFWDEVVETEDYFRDPDSEIRVSTEAVILNLIFRYVRTGVFRNLSNKALRKLGSEIKFYEGLPEFFKTLKDNVRENPRYRAHGISVEHYILSTGLRQMILGSSIAPFVDGVWGSEFLELDMGSKKARIDEIAYMLDHTTKTRAIFEINKGSNKNIEIDVNASMDEAIRRVPFFNMIYIADGPSDIPAFSIVNRFGGRTYAVYQTGSKNDFAQSKKLLDDRRVHAFGEAKYTKDSSTYMWLSLTVEEIADRIVEGKETALRERMRSPPIHFH
jgi:hypothetical protein